MSDLKQAELSAIFEAAPLAMAVLEADAAGATVFHDLNAAFLQFLQMSGADLSGKQISFWFREADVLSIGALLLPEVQGSYLAFESTISVPEVENQRCFIRAQVIADSCPKRLLLTVEHVKEVDPQDKDLKASGDQQREDFIATLSHDLKTPIVGANMVLKALLDGSVGELTGSQKEIIEKLKTSNQSLLEMIHNLLEVYKYESGTESLRFASASLNQIIDFCFDDVRPLFENKSIELVSRLPVEEILLVCDEYAIKRVLVNLLGNAVKFTPAGGSITVTAEDDAESARLIVNDTGRGMSADEKKRIFQRFWQGEPGRRYAAGTGLGLYFSYNVVKAHGGTIVCESEPGQGTSFVITLPKQIYAKSR